jgi:hypothetical protein
MRLLHDIDLGYCTNIHRGETWEETFSGLRDYTDQVRERISGGKSIRYRPPSRCEGSGATVIESSGEGSFPTVDG